MLPPRSSSRLECSFGQHQWLGRSVLSQRVAEYVSTLAASHSPVFGPLCTEECSEFSPMFAEDILIYPQTNP